MKRIFLVTLLAGTVLGIAAPAEAHGGCGHGWHRGVYGNCRPNYGVDYIAVAPGGYAVAAVPEADMFYPGLGSWDGNRYYMHREHWDGAWRYW